MYSTFLPTKRSGNWFGAHQKFDKLAYRLLLPCIKPGFFPKLEDMLHFEGYNGPDGLIAKSPGKNEPRHYYDPKREQGPVLEHIASHFEMLVTKLRQQDYLRAAFEAAWLAHAVTDGLTPAHHHGYVEKVKDLHAQANHQVSKVRDKVIIKGSSGRETMRHTWQLWRSKGQLTSHTHFEAGVASALVTSGLSNLYLPEPLFAAAKKLGPVKFFQAQARLIDHLGLFDRFTKNGWTIGLARQVRKVLAPAIAQTIAIVWLLAYAQAGNAVDLSQPVASLDTVPVRIDH
ncbi:hypothetical protein HY441_00705 [Candidatus Microgenomates bacterium]|nr:hypothetical protein [Candidatus Microgenomates bacterium]